MRWRMLSLIGLLGFLAAGEPVGGGPSDESLVYLPLVARGFGAPVLKWALGGCYNWGCETGWYSSPAVANVDGAGGVEVIGATYSVVALDGATGVLKWRTDPPGGRAWPGVVVADLDNNGQLDIVTAHGDGYWHVFNGAGQITLSRQPTPGSELRTLAVADLDNDGTLEVAVAATRSNDQFFVYEHTGDVRAGQWPQHSPDSDANGYAAGAYNSNLGIADLDGDDRGELIGPTDVHYITAYQDDGAQMLANALYGLGPGSGPKPWSRVGVHVDHAVDLRGYAFCGTEHRPNFAASAPTLADLDGNGKVEIVVVGNVYNCGGAYTSLYDGLFIFRPDRTRWAAGAFNWTVIPVPDGASAPLTENYNVIENNQPNPVVADLNGDGRLEILFPSYDGRLHAYWLDRTEHGAWPFEVYQPAEGYYRFASEPAVADLDGNGQAEVIFTSWSQKGSNGPGRLYVVSALGSLIYVVDLPQPAGQSWNGALGAPTLANIDADPDLEVVLNTAHTGLVAYDLPGTANAILHWPTGRGSYLRAGTPGP